MHILNFFALICKWYILHPFSVAYLGHGDSRLSKHNVLLLQLLLGDPGAFTGQVDMWTLQLLLGLPQGLLPHIQKL